MGDFNKEKQMAMATALRAPRPMEQMQQAPDSGPQYPDVAPAEMMGSENPQGTQDVASIDAALQALRASGLHKSDPSYTARMQQLYATRDSLMQDPEAKPTDLMVAGR